MPRPRKTNSRKVQKSLFILCEGAKTEPEYFKALIKMQQVPGNRLRVVDTEKNSARELVKEAKKIKKRIDFAEGDIVWVVFDKDGYTEHAKAFDEARRNNVEIAFSSISFEVWILLHFAYTTKEFLKSEDVIKELKTKHGYAYQKSSPNIYYDVCSKQDIAIRNAKQLRATQSKSNYSSTPHKLNPYTNVDELVELIISFSK